MKILSAIAVAAVIFLCFASLSHADGPPDADGAAIEVNAPDLSAPSASAPDNEVDAIKRAYAAIQNNDWRSFAALVLILITLVVRRFEAKLPGWFRGDRGGVVLVFVLALLGTAGSAALAGASFASLGLYGNALVLALQAIGGYVGIKRLLWPKTATAEEATTATA